MQFSRSDDDAIKDHTLWRIEVGQHTEMWTNALD